MDLIIKCKSLEPHAEDGVRIIRHTNGHFCISVTENEEVSEVIINAQDAKAIADELNS